MRLANPKPGENPYVRVIKTEEKGSDVNLATYLLVDAFRGAYDQAVVISNDSDLAEPIRFVQTELGRPVGLINPHPPHRRSRKLLSLDPQFFKQIRRPVLAKSQFAEVLTDAAGRRIRKPREWH
jgi:NYN domain